MSLVRIASGRRIPGGSPLAFGEGGIKERVKRLLNFKKPSRVIVIAAAALAAVLFIGFAVNTASDAQPQETMPSESVSEQLIGFEAVYDGADTSNYGMKLKWGDRIYQANNNINMDLQSARDRIGNQIGYMINYYGDESWLHEEPQMYCPIVLVGYNNALYSFRECLTGFEIEGPYVDWSEQVLEPGFSVWMLIEKTESSTSSFMRGYNEALSVERIMMITDMLIEGTLP